MPDISLYTPYREALGEEGAVLVGKDKPFSGLFVFGQGKSPAFPSILKLAEGSSARICILALPGACCHIDLRVELLGQGASLVVKGFCLASGQDNLSISTTVFHRVPDCRSEQLFNIIAGGSAKTAFNGRIVVAPDAMRTEAKQTNHNILLSENARAQTQPQLEIYADDVQCSHGATVGQLGEEELFYMRSRGISEIEAKTLRLISLASPILDLIEDAEVAGEQLKSIEEAIRKTLSL